jgi:hypothetical protein
MFILSPTSKISNNDKILGIPKRVTGNAKIIQSLQNY